MFEAVLFDLDGTFADTAPDLAAALNRLRADLDLAPVPPGGCALYLAGRTRHAQGRARRCCRVMRRYVEFYDRFLHYYSQDICVETTLFPGIDELLDGLESALFAMGNRHQQGAALHPAAARPAWATPSAPPASSVAIRRAAPSRQHTRCSWPAR
jgi:phosphoglycolate phosphatase-like HAD superfamily hydrolase